MKNAMSPSDFAGSENDGLASFAAGAAQAGTDPVTHVRHTPYKDDLCCDA